MADRAMGVDREGRDRTARVSRATKETQIEAEVALDCGIACDVATGIGFFDHMLTQVAYHARISLRVACSGDLHVDDHHTVEDVGITIGAALRQALGECAGIVRYGSAIVPMDESLVLCALDISGRGLASLDLPIAAERVGDLGSETVAEFFTALARSAQITIHIRRLAGENSHHLIEAAFKSFARALREAIRIETPGGSAPSTKGML